MTINVSTPLISLMGLRHCQVSVIMMYVCIIITVGQQSRGTHLHNLSLTDMFSSLSHVTVFDSTSCVCEASEVDGDSFL